MKCVKCPNKAVSGKSLCKRCADSPTAPVRKASKKKSKK